MKKLADYAYKVIDQELYIKDLNLGNISLTNSLEYVLQEIASKEGEGIKNLTIYQRDSTEEVSQVTWDGKDKVFWHPLNELENARVTILFSLKF